MGSGQHGARCIINPIDAKCRKPISYIYLKPVSSLKQVKPQAPYLDVSSVLIFTDR